MIHSSKYIPLLQPGMAITIADRFPRSVPPGIGLSFANDVDGLIVFADKYQYRIPGEDLRRAFESDDYEAIKLLAARAGDYLADRLIPHGRKRRAFRTKQRNIHARRHHG